MKTIILPGYSPKNLDWAQEIKKELKLPHQIIVHEWQHWPPAHRASGSARQGSFSMPREIKSLLSKIGTDEVNIIAKSVGTRVAMTLAPNIPKQINKIILCGIPTKGETENAKKTYSNGLNSLSPTQVMVFQNTKDPFANYQTINKFIGSISPKVRVIEKPRNDHHYPYAKDFQIFLKD